MYEADFLTAAETQTYGAQPQKDDERLGRLGIADEPPLSRVGPYRLVRTLGGGGMARVYEAWNDAIGRRVALKLLRPEYIHNRELTQRFFFEARLTNLVQHPGLVVVHEHGTLPSGQAYVVMEYLEGEPLSRYLLGPSWELAEGLRLLRQVGAVLRALHAAGIIHRDLTPSNIMVVPDPEVPGGRRIKLLDLGIAKVNAAGVAALSTSLQALLEDDDSPTLPMAKAGRLLGTPNYMAPEQIAAPEQADAPADVYALGVLLFEAAAGRVPFEGTLTQVLNSHLHDEPPSLRRVSPGAPRALARLVAQMMAKEPAARPTLAEVDRALARIIERQRQPHSGSFWSPFLWGGALV